MLFLFDLLGTSWTLFVWFANIRKRPSFNLTVSDLMLFHISQKRSSAFQPLVSPEPLLTHLNLFIYGQVSSMYHLRSSAHLFNFENVASMHLHLPRIRKRLQIFTNLSQNGGNQPPQTDSQLGPKGQKVGFSYCFASLFLHSASIAFWAPCFLHPKTFANWAVFYFLLGAALAV